MGTDLLSIFKKADLKEVGKTTGNIISLALKYNKKTGAKIARAVLDDGSTLIKRITASGVVSETIHKIPEILSIPQRNNIIRDLAKNNSSNAGYFPINSFKRIEREVKKQRH